jgi:hypothetical protein
MQTTNRYDMLIEAYTELAPEIAAAGLGSKRTKPGISHIVAEHNPLPRAALFLGVAEDGLPVLLNLLDPVPGSILIAGDAGSGKTRMLQTIARGVDHMHTPQDVQYGIITTHPDEWQELNTSQNCVQVFPSYKEDASVFLNSLASWAHSNHGEKQSVLLFIDDLSMVSKMDHEARQNLRWLLLRGPARRVWPIVTIDPRNVESVQAWLELFRTRCFGKIRDENHLHCLANSTDPELKSLLPGTEFAMREDRDWLKFWLPTLD